VALERDVCDVQSGTTEEGIHLVMCGPLDLIQRGFVGSEIRDGVLLYSIPAHRPPRRAFVPDAIRGHADTGSARRRPRSPLTPKASAGRSGSALAATSTSSAPATRHTFTLKRN
jgi:hypothetical protein